MWDEGANRPRSSPPENSGSAFKPNDESSAPLSATDEHARYFRYLLTRTRLGLWYRHFWLYPRLMRHLAGQILDVGCGIGDFLRYHRGAMGVDINPYAVAYCRSLGLNAIQISPNSLPFPSGSFDSALLDNVLEHLSEPEPLLREIHRVLRNQGTLVVGVPGKKGFAADPDHKTFYDLTSLVRTLSPLGYAYRGHFHTPFFLGKIGEQFRIYCLYASFIKKDPHQTPTPTHYPTTP